MLIFFLVWNYLHIFFRRVLALGAHSAELYNNLGLCCLYSQQLDLTLSCFQRALDTAAEFLIRAEVWYNLAHTALVSFAFNYDHSNYNS